VVSLAGDMAYEGARSVYGPLLASLGASATTVGLVTGAGEATALLLRLVSGPFADHTRRYWTLTMLGHTLTAVWVPVLVITPGLGTAGLIVSATLILAERLGKAIRNPTSHRPSVGRPPRNRCNTAPDCGAFSSRSPSRRPGPPLKLARPHVWKRSAGQRRPGRGRRCAARSGQPWRRHRTLRR
jgi:hypothetical protein